MFWTKKPSNSTPANKASRSGRRAAAPPAGSASQVPAVPVTASSGIEERIRARAYQLFLERKGQGGSAEQDWLRAEAEVCAGKVA
jgi:hypothetical protein